MTTIELGDVTSAPRFEPSPGTYRRSVRPFAVILVLLITLLAVTGAERPPASGLRTVWTIPMSEADELMLGTDTAYVNRNVAGTSTVGAYDLATGARRWETTVTDTNASLQLAEPAGLLLLNSDQYDAELRYRRLTTALDTRTGRRVWAAEGQAGEIESGTALMAEYTALGTTKRLRLMRLGDQTSVWSRDTPALHQFTVDDDRIVTATVDGRVEILRLADGTPVIAAPVRWVRPDPEAGQYDNVTVTGNHIVVTRNWRGDGDVTVYALDTLAEEWRHPGIGEGYAFPCGRAVCVCVGSLLTAFDTDTGRQLWQWLGANNPWAAADDRVVVDRGGDGLLMLDPDTGRQVGLPVRGGTTVWTLDPTDDVYVLHPTSQPPGRSSVTRWDVSTGHSRVLGTLDLLTGYRCQIRGRYLACNRDSRLEVTAVR